VTDFGSPTVPAAYPTESELRREEGDSALWADSGLGLPKGPAPAFSKSPDARSEDQMPTIGHIGRYALKYRIGEGGLGTVYAAHDPLLSRLIAIKTLNLELSPEERESFNALFLNEARAAAGLSHPHIVTVFDAGTSDNSAYIAMELLKGRDLRQLRQEGWRPTPEQAALIVRRVADALAYAHSKGVVHRDVKPANIFMVGRTQPRMLDFGIARVAHRHDGGGDLAAGSPYYMAPEQARHQTVDRRADVFSLGVVLYELLTDQKPFRGSTLAEISQAVIEHEPPLACEVDPRVPRALADIAARAMVKDPEQRYRSARTFSRELRHWLEDSEAGAGAVAPAKPPRRWRVWGGGAAAALALAGAALWMVQSPERAPAPPAAGVLSADASAATAPASSAPAAPVPMPNQVLQAGDASVATPPDAGTPAPPATPTATRPPGNGSRAGASKPKPAAPKPAAAKARPDSRREAANASRGASQGKAAAAAPQAQGIVRLAVSPWGAVEVDGAPAGTTPPLTELTLAEGKHLITIRNADFPPFSTTVTVTPGQAVSVRHKFGS
jgi:eukaryotic-like serine/threonine-protein kinase